jgi:peptidoglycan/LPS O-acetylase OafA/YrhL
VTASRSGDLPFLHGIRALAALWVVIAHCMIWGGWFALVREADTGSLGARVFAWSSGLAMSAKTAVDVFMLLSGYLMQYWAQRRLGVVPAVGLDWARAFYVRRFFRIAPAFYASLLLAILLAGPFLDGYAALRTLDPTHWSGDTIYDPRRIEYTWGNVIAHLTFVFGLIPSLSFSTMLPDWSLSLEMQFYLAFPLLFMLTARRGFAVATVVALIASVLLLRWFARLPGPTGLPGVFPEPSFLLLKLPLFLAGMLLCSAATHDRTRRFWLLSLVALVILVQFRYDHYAFVTALAAGLMGWLSMAHPVWPRAAGRVQSILGGRIATLGGDLSYSVYLLHGFALALIGGSLATVDWFVGWSAAPRVALIALLVVPTTYLAAWAMFSTVEAPLNRIGRRLARRLEARRSRIEAAI